MRVLRIVNADGVSIGCLDNAVAVLGGSALNQEQFLLPFGLAHQLAVNLIGKDVHVDQVLHGALWHNVAWDDAITEQMVRPCVRAEPGDRPELRARLVPVARPARQGADPPARPASADPPASTR